MTSYSRGDQAIWTDAQGHLRHELILRRKGEYVKTARGYWLLTEQLEREVP